MKGFAFVFLVLPFCFGCSSMDQKALRTTASETQTEVRCGIRFGIAGDASLVNSFNEVLTLAVQSGDQTLLNQMDKFIEGGSQLGQRYCVKVELQYYYPSAILDAAEVTEICGYRFGTGHEVSLVSGMSAQEELIDLTVHSKDGKTLLQQLDSLVSGGSQVGTRYCVDARKNSRNSVSEILGAREY